MVFIVIVLLWLATSLAGGLVIGVTIRRGGRMPRDPAHRQKVIRVFARRTLCAGLTGSAVVHQEIRMARPLPST